jgi:geranylgeranyl pyrophosphate synthase
MLGLNYFRSEGKGVTLQIASIFEPVQEDLLKVEQGLKAITRVDFPWTAEMLKHVLGDGGKRIRPALTLLAGKLYNYDSKLLIPMAIAVELTHTATLIHDDAIDKSPIRRGKDTINKLWGDTAAVLLGDYLFAAAAYLASTTGNSRIASISAQTVETISAGELRQSFNAYKLKQTRNEYFQRIGCKTASLFSMATECGAILSQTPEEAIKALKNYGYELGMAFQVVDDILDFIGDEGIMGKPVGSDLLQGTLTLPAMLLLERYPEDNPVESIFSHKGNGEDLKLALEMVRNSSIVDDCYKTAREFSSRACHALKGLPPGLIHSSLSDLAEYLLERKS